MSTPTKWGSEFLVNTTTADEQRDSSVTALADGRFVVVFTDESRSPDDNDADAVRAQIFNADGSKSGSEFLVNTTTTNSQLNAEVTALSDGRFVVAFTDLSRSVDDDDGYAVRAQIFNADGSQSGAEFLVNTATIDDQAGPQIAALDAGRFVVTYVDVSETSADTDGYAVRAQIFNADGSKSGSELLVNSTFTTSDQFTPTITTLANGRFVVAFVDSSAASADNSSNAVLAQIFEANGTKFGSEFLVNTATLAGQDEASITALANGGFVVVYKDESGSGADSSFNAVRGQVFAANGTKSGSEFLVNTTTSESQFDPSVTALSDGRFVVAFTDASAAAGDTSSYAVRAQVFNADGTKSGSEFLVNTTTFQGQNEASLIALADGRIVVTFTDQSQSADDTFVGAVRGQIFDPRIAGIDIEGTGDADAFVGSDFADTIEGKSGADTIEGGGGKDELLGGGGKDILKGGNGADELFGGNGRDTIEVGKGKDSAYGGGGKDVFVFNKNEGKNTIYDFKNGKDKIDLSGFGFASKSAALAKFFEMGGANNDKLGFSANSTKITIKGIDMSDLNKADIII